MKKLIYILFSFSILSALYLVVKSFILYVFIIRLNYSQEILDSQTISTFLNIWLFTSFIIATVTSFYMYKNYILINNSKLTDYYKIKLNIKEFFRPWKITTLIIGIIVLIIGAKITNLPDWDIPISIIMALLTYIMGSISINYMICQKTFTSYIFATLVYLICVDFSYVLYNFYNNHIYFRFYNLLASSILYVICSFLWALNGSLKDILIEFKKIKYQKIKNN